jgi:hypothetical protein
MPNTHTSTLKRNQRPLKNHSYTPFVGMLFTQRRGWITPFSLEQTVKKVLTVKHENKDWEETNSFS